MPFCHCCVSWAWLLRRWSARLPFSLRLWFAQTRSNTWTDGQTETDSWWQSVAKLIIPSNLALLLGRLGSDQYNNSKTLAQAFSSHISSHFSHGDWEQGECKGAVHPKIKSTSFSYYLSRLLSFYIVFVWVEEISVIETSSFSRI